MTIDLIIPIYKPDKLLRKSLLRIQKQTVKPNRIILINTEESLLDMHLIEDIEKVELYHISKPEFDHGGTRNMAAAKSDADIVMFMTQDAVPATRDLVKNLVKQFEDPEVAAAYARQLADPHKNLIEAYTRTFNYPKESSKKSFKDLDRLGIKTFFCSNVCAAYRKSDYDAMGGFVLKTIFNEDSIMASKLVEAGKTIAYAADAKVWHWHNYTTMEQLHRNFDLAVSQKDYGGLFLEVKSESEGVKLVKSTLHYLAANRKLYLIPKLILQSAGKYIGYKLGIHYDKLPRFLILKLTMNPSYWND